jgi:hypothetical protein
MFSIRIARVVLVFAALLAVSAQGEPARSNAPPGLTTHVYDVRDLLIVIPDFNSHPDLRRSTVPPATQPTTQPTRDQLVDALKRSVQVILAGAPGASVCEMEGQLVVTAPADRQERLARALAAARQARRAQVSVEIKFLKLTSAAVAALDAPLRDKIDAALMQDRQALMLTPTQVDALSKAGQTLVAAPRITLFQNQRAYVRVQSDLTYVSGFSVTSAPDGSHHYDPKLSSVAPGVLADIRAGIAPDQSAISLNLRVQMASLLGIKEQPAPGARPQDKLIVQVPDLRVQETQCLLTLAPDQWALLRVADAIPTTMPPDTHAFVLVKPMVLPLEIHQNSSP